jgi:hypothetical protein
MESMFGSTARTKRRVGSIAVGFIGAIIVSALLAAPVASAHPSGVHWVKLTAGTSSSVRSTSFGHGTHTLTMIAYFGRVTSTSAYLDHVTFKYSAIDSCVHGGKVYVWNSNLQLTYTGDGSATYCSASSWTRQVDRTFYRGQTNGKASVAVEKNSLDSYWCTPVACGAHRSSAVFYVP